MNRSYLLSLHVTAAYEQDREQIGVLSQGVQRQTDRTVELAFVDRGYTGEEPAEAAGREAIKLSVVKLPEAERSIAWLTRLRRLAKDYERLASTLKGMCTWQPLPSSCWLNWHASATVHNTL